MIRSTEGSYQMVSELVPVPVQISASSSSTTASVSPSSASAPAPAAVIDFAMLRNGIADLRNDLAEIRRDSYLILSLVLDLSSRFDSSINSTDLHSDGDFEASAASRIADLHDTTIQKVEMVMREPREKSIMLPVQLQIRCRPRQLRRRGRFWQIIKSCSIVPAVIVGGRRCVQKSRRRKGIILNRKNCIFEALRQNFFHQDLMYNFGSSSVSSNLPLVPELSILNLIAAELFESLLRRLLLLNYGHIFFSMRDCWDPGGLYAVLGTNVLIGRFLISVFLLFVEMMVYGFSPDWFIFPFVCANIADLKAGEQVQVALIKRENEIDVFLCNSLVHFYCEWGDLVAAQEVFDEMADRDVVLLSCAQLGRLMEGKIDSCRKLIEAIHDKGLISWNSLMAAHAQNGFPYSSTWSALLNGCRIYKNPFLELGICSANKWEKDAKGLKWLNYSLLSRVENLNSLTTIFQSAKSKLEVSQRFGQGMSSRVLAVIGLCVREAMLQGVNEVADVVKVTMGPRGRNVVIEDSRVGEKVTKDGATVAKAIEFRDKAKNFGADLIKQVVRSAKKSVGDGSTCITVLAQAVLTEGNKEVAAGVNVMDLRCAINQAIESVLSYLKSKAVMISTPEQIAQIASVSANCDHMMGDLIVRALEKVSKDGVITVSDGNTLLDELDVFEGMKLARGYIFPYFANDQHTQKCELENPLILIYDKKIRDVDSLVSIVEKALERKKPLLIVVEDVESDALKMLKLNKHEIGLKVCAIKASGFGDSRKANLKDLAILTGGEVISEDRGFTLTKTKPEMLGTAKKVTVSVDDTIILQGGGDKLLIEERYDKLRKSVEESAAVFDKEKVRERLSKLSGGVAVLKIGGASDTEVGERKGRAKDALQATYAAIEEGVLPGGGVALLYAARELDKLQTSNIGQKDGVQIIQKAMKAPTYTIAANAGVEGAIVVRKLLETNEENLLL